MLLNTLTPSLQALNSADLFDPSVLRYELLNREIFTTLTETKVLIEQLRKEYNQVRPHGPLGYQPPA
jgi:transposase InsO family protein